MNSTTRNGHYTSDDSIGFDLDADSLGTNAASVLDAIARVSAEACRDRKALGRILDRHGLDDTTNLGVSIAEAAIKRVAVILS